VKCLFFRRAAIFVLDWTGHPATRHLLVNRAAQCAPHEAPFAIRMSAMKRESRPRKTRCAKKKERPPTPIGATAVDGDTTLRAFQVGALPLINHFLERLGLADTLRQYLPPDDARLELPTERIVLLLVRNILVSREPIYAVPEWAAQYGPELFDLFHADIPLLNDDRLGACLARLYTVTTPELILAVVRRANRVFNVSLDELHNDSTSVTLHGHYFSAAKPQPRGDRTRPAITWGHNKDHRPDLKQLLLTLTVANDGGVPVYFSVDSGNTTDDTTHRATWDILVSLIGRRDFLYVADCKLASRENLRHIAVRGGRFITVLPQGRTEDTEFRARLKRSLETIQWRDCWQRENDMQLRDRNQRQKPPKVIDVIRVCEQEQLTSEGFRLLWFHSSRKADLDDLTRSQRVQRVIKELEELHQRLVSPRTRFHKHQQVKEAVDAILSDRQAEGLLEVEITETRKEVFRQQGRGRPSAKTRYRREARSRFQLSWSIDERRWREDSRDDGVFPLLTNDRLLSAREVLEAYKRQPKIEKRFAQLKSDYDLAPVFLKTPERVLGLMTAYFLALLVQSLIERELRGALQRNTTDPHDDDLDPQAIDIYPERRRTRRPTTRRVMDVLEPIRRYEIHSRGADNAEPQLLFDSLTDIQQRLLKLLGMEATTYGR
jgi:transposase